MKSPATITPIIHVDAALLGTRAELDAFAIVKLSEENERAALGITDEAFAAAGYDHDFALFVHRQEQDAKNIAAREQLDEARESAYNSWRAS